MAGPRVTRLDRYVLRQLLVALLATTGGLVALIWLTQSLRFVQLVLERGLSLGVFLGLTGLLIPSFVAVILPITTFVVVQFVYQRLSGDREITVMRAAGLSDLALARPALALATLAMLICYGLNVWVVPASFTAFREYQFEIRNKMAAFLLEEGVFTPISNDLTVYIRRRDSDGTLHGILVEDDRQKDSRATILAESGRIVETGGAPRVLLFNGSREEVDRRTGRLDVLTFSENSIDLADSAKGVQARYRDADELPMGALLHPDPRVVARRDFGKFAVEWNRRLAAPLTVLSFAMVALVAVLAGGFQRHANVLRPAAAIGTVVLLLALQLVAQNLAARLPLLMPLIWVVAALPGVIAAASLFRPSPAPLPARLSPPLGA